MGWRVSFERDREPVVTADGLRRSAEDRVRLTRGRRRQFVAAHPGARPLGADAPGDVWTADHTGEFGMGDGESCYPLTVCDAYSRYVLAADGHGSVEASGALRTFDRLFRERGLPRSIRTDNGTLAATQVICGLSRLTFTLYASRQGKV